MKLALYQPDIAGNVGTIMRLAACLNLELIIIEPCGFPWDDKKIRRSAMDYFHKVKLTKYEDFNSFKKANAGSRVILMTTKGAIKYTNFTFNQDDIVMVGRESAGVPDSIHQSVDARLVIPMCNNMRCLNVAISLAMVTGEAMRQCKLL